MIRVGTVWSPAVRSNPRAPALPRPSRCRSASGMLFWSSRATSACAPKPIPLSAETPRDSAGRAGGERRSGHPCAVPSATARATWPIGMSSLLASKHPHVCLVDHDLAAQSLGARRGRACLGNCRRPCVERHFGPACCRRNSWPPMASRKALARLTSRHTVER